MVVISETKLFMKISKRTEIKSSFEIETGMTGLLIQSYRIECRLVPTVFGFLPLVHYEAFFIS